MTRSSIVSAFALVAIASTGALAQQPAPRKTDKDAQHETMKADRDTLKSIKSDEKSTKRALKAARAAKDTVKVRQLTQELAREKAEKRTLKAKLPPKKDKPAKTKP